MSPIYTDMHFKIMPRKKDRGRRPESEKINKNDRTSSVPQTCAEHERLQGPPHNTGAVAAARGSFTYIRLHAEKRTARLCAEQGRNQAPSSTKNEVQAVVAAKSARTCVIYNRYTLTCIYRLFFSLCAEQERKQAPSATKQSRGVSSGYVRTK